MAPFPAPRRARAQFPRPSTGYSIPLDLQPYSRREARPSCCRERCLSLPNARRNPARLGQLPCVPTPPSHHSFGGHRVSISLRRFPVLVPNPFELYRSAHSSCNGCVLGCRSTLPTTG